MPTSLSTRLPTRAQSKPFGTRRMRTLFLILVTVYGFLILAVATRSSLVDLDQLVTRLDFAHSRPDWQAWITRFELLGQRGPVLVLVTPLVGWVSYRRRTWRPLVMFGVAVALLNLTVGVVKVLIGRLGPLTTLHPTAVFDGGDLFPSGHTANAVVMYGVLAMVAIRRRRAMTLVAVALSVAVGIGTLFLETHWLTDVLGGWLSGALVLLVLPASVDGLGHGVAAARRWATGSVKRAASRRLAAHRSAPPSPRFAVGTVPDTG